eukprot:GCRY01001082.1.p1 GENE.GCRY01001082.1~~GCRY01001082.1.p1  ORF type:complete len:314 (-),score=7.45 GCRY01001082.1:298-1239(-)
MSSDSYSSDEQKELYTSSIVSASLSVFGCCLIFFLYFRYGKAQKILGKVIFSLTLANFFGSIAIIFSLSSELSSNACDDSSWCGSTTTCKASRLFIQFFYTSSFVWSSCFAHALYQDFVQSHYSVSSLLRMYHALSWGIPFLFDMVLITFDGVEKGRQGWCSAKRPFKLAFWYIPCILSFCFNAFVYAKVLISISCGTHSHQLLRKWRGKVAFRLTGFLAVFWLCWVLDIIVGASNMNASLTTDMIKDFLFPLQGFLNCIVYGLTNSEIRMRMNFCLGGERHIGDEVNLHAPIVSHSPGVTHTSYPSYGRQAE